MNQGKLEVVKQEMARVNVDILGISELKWNGMVNLTQMTIRRNAVAIMVNKTVWNAVLGCNLKNDRMISVHFQGKPFNITVIQVYAPTSNTEEAEVERFALEMNRDHSAIFENASNTAIQTLLLTMMATSFPLTDSCPQ